jgi:hypothetical protein
LPPPPPGGAPRAPYARPPGAAVAAASTPRLGAVEQNFGEDEDTKEKVPFVILDFLALAASVAFAILLWNYHATLLASPWFTL